MNCTLWQNVLVLLCNTICRNRAFMKKILLLVLSCFLLNPLSAVFAVDEYQSQMSYYENLSSCSPGRFSLGIMGEYQIYGVKNNKCYTKETLGARELCCVLPPSVAKRYAQEGRKAMLKERAVGAIYSPYIIEVNNTYCSEYGAIYCTVS